MVELVQKLEERVTRLIQELESNRVAKTQLEAENYGLRVTVADHDQIKSELEEAQGLITLYEEERQEVEELRGAAAELGTVKNELQAVRAELDGANARVAELQAWHEGTVRHRDEIQGQLDGANAQVGDLAAERDSVRAELEGAQSRIAELEEWHAGTARHRDEIQGQLDGANARLGELENEANALRNELEAARHRIDEMHGQTGDFARIEGENQSLRQEISDLQARVNEAGERDQRMRDRLNMLLERIEAAESHLAEVEMAHETA